MYCIMPSAKKMGDYKQGSNPYTGGGKMWTDSTFEENKEEED